MPKRKKTGRGPSRAELARRAQQRAAREGRLTPASPEARQAASRAAVSRDEALHVDARDWREVKLQGRESEIVAAVQSGDTSEARRILEEVRANAGGCEVCKRLPADGEGYVLSTTEGRAERRWGHRECLGPMADSWHSEGRAPLWTVGRSIFTDPGEESEPHIPAS